MKFSEIKDLTKEELIKRMKILREDLFESKMKHALGQLGNPIHLREARRNMARLKTAFHIQMQKIQKEVKK